MMAFGRQNELWLQLSLKLCLEIVALDVSDRFTCECCLVSLCIFCIVE